MIWLLNKFKGYLAIAGAAIAAIGYIYLRGRSAGKADAIEAVRKETDKVKEKWDEIDAREPDLDAALDGLRKRSADGPLPKAPTTSGKRGR